MNVPASAKRSRYTASARRTSTESNSSGVKRRTRGWCCAIVSVTVSRKICDWIVAPIQQRGARLVPERLDRAAVDARLGDPEPRQLEHRLEILRRRSAVESLAVVADLGADVGALAGEPLRERGRVEAAEPTGVERHRRELGLRHVLVGDEGGAAGALRPEQDLIALEVGRLEERPARRWRASIPGCRSPAACARRRSCPAWEAWRRAGRPRWSRRTP